MTFKEFLEGLAKIDRPSEMELSPGPYTLKVNSTDGEAARVLMRLDEMIDDDTKLKEGEGILMHNALLCMDADSLDDDGWYTEEARIFLYAWWWLVFWAAQKNNWEGGS